MIEIPFVLFMLAIFIPVWVANRVIEAKNREIALLRGRLAQLEKKMSEPCGCKKLIEGRHEPNCLGEPYTNRRPTYEELEIKLREVEAYRDSVIWQLEYERVLHEQAIAQRDDYLARLREIEAERDALREALERLVMVLDTLRVELDTKYPALAEAYVLANVELTQSKKDQK
jgi:chromosome segregation ATPase